MIASKGPALELLPEHVVATADPFPSQERETLLETLCDASARNLGNSWRALGVADESHLAGSVPDELGVN